MLKQREAGTSVLDEIQHGELATPLVLRGWIDSWQARTWSPATFAHGPLADVRTAFRFARRSSPGTAARFRFVA